MVALEKNERVILCEPEFIKLLTVLMIADSKSYTFLDEEVTEEAREEFFQKQAHFLYSFDKLFAQYSKED